MFALDQKYSEERKEMLKKPEQQFFILIFQQHCHLGIFESYQNETIIRTLLNRLWPSEFLNRTTNNESQSTQTFRSV